MCHALSKGPEAEDTVIQPFGSESQVGGGGKGLTVGREPLYFEAAPSGD